MSDRTRHRRRDVVLPAGVRHPCREFRMPRRVGLSRGRTSLSRQRGLRAGVFHPRLMIGNPAHRLPVLSQKPNGLDWIKPGIEHPVMGRTEPRQIIGEVISGVVIQVGYLQTSRHLQTTDRAAAERIGRVRHAARFGLFSDRRRRLHGMVIPIPQSCVDNYPRTNNPTVSATPPAVAAALAAASAAEPTVATPVAAPAAVAKNS